MKGAKRETLIALKATHTAYRVATDVMHPTTTELQQSRQEQETRRESIRPTTEFPERRLPAEWEDVRRRAEHRHVIMQAMVVLLAAILIICGLIFIKRP